MEGYDRRREIGEAIEAGEQALSSLREAQKQLDSAGNWGLLDIFGGSTVSGVMKHMKVNNAERSIQDAKRDMEKFRSELQDVHGIEDLDIDIGGFWTFADFFFDGLISDIYVQSKIGKAKRQVQEAVTRVGDIVQKLRMAY